MPKVMFSGLIRIQGDVIECHDDDQSRQLRIHIRSPFREKHAVGDSIACNGVCLTVTECDETTFKVFVGDETLKRTSISTWRTGTVLNLEPSLRLGDPLDGHLLYGHVDGVGRLVSREALGAASRYRFSFPKELHTYLAVKGSIAIDGVSLTIIAIDDDENTLDLMLIPHTLKQTHFQQLSINHPINLEVDMIARYVARQCELIS